MRQTRMILIAATGAALLAGCNRGISTNSQANVTTPAANLALPKEPEPAAPPALPETAPVDQAFLVGHWSDDPNCARTISLNADGTAARSDSGGTGRWSLEGDLLVMDELAPVTAGRDGDMLVLTANGRQGRLTRCTEAAPPPGADAPAPGAYEKNRSD